MRDDRFAPVGGGPLPTSEAGLWRWRTGQSRLAIWRRKRIGLFLGLLFLLPWLPSFRPKPGEPRAARLGVVPPLTVSDRGTRVRGSDGQTIDGSMSRGHDVAASRRRRRGRADHRWARLPEGRRHLGRRPIHRQRRAGHRPVRPAPREPISAPGDPRPRDERSEAIARREDPGRLERPLHRDPPLGTRRPARADDLARPFVGRDQHSFRAGRPVVGIGGERGPNDPDLGSCHQPATAAVDPAACSNPFPGVLVRRPTAGCCQRKRESGPGLGCPDGGRDPDDRRSFPPHGLSFSSTASAGDRGRRWEPRVSGAPRPAASSAASTAGPTRSATSRSRPTARCWPRPAMTATCGSGMWST